MALDAQTTLDLVVLAGSCLGATAAALLPFWAKIRQQIALGEPVDVFSKMFMGTLLMSFVIGLAAAAMSYSANVANANPSQTLITTFIVAAVAAFGSNKALNGVLAVPSTVTSAALIKAQNDTLKEEITILKGQLDKTNKVSEGVDTETTESHDDPTLPSAQGSQLSHPTPQNKSFLEDQPTTGSPVHSQ